MPIAIPRYSQNAKHFLVVPHALLHVVHTEIDDRAKITWSKSLDPKSTDFEKGRMTANRAEALLEPTLKALSTAYERLLQLQPLTDACTDCPIAAFDIAPSVALVDISLTPLAITLLPQLNIAANIHVKLVCWAPSSAKGEMEVMVRSKEIFSKSSARWDALVHLWPARLEPDRITSSHFTGIRVLHIPLNTDDSKAMTARCDPSTHAFLQHHKASRGDHSVIYIALDDSPFSTETLRTLLPVLHRTRTPYLLALPPANQRTLDLARSLPLTDPELGHLLPSGTASRAVLAHSATMALLTRGSSAAVLSAIQHDVPLIFYPESYDQHRLATTFSTEPYKFGMKLHQKDEGSGTPPKSSTGLTDEETDEALREQFEHIIQDLTGGPDQALRERIEAIRNDVMEEAASGHDRRALDFLLHL
ncbi:hypothetical protein DB88DRAFT_542119 [Papiliotrema laurentii]|uniref:Uncharacterized protein n=1 Tax=Papiliotrema laurentii TaxID=5418 RepID=A0AAD9CU73_PAPLA|nr:hypothetical protein DB88DRAFT_542119 [Papiliotrema laurentii]